MKRSIFSVFTALVVCSCWTTTPAQTSNQKKPNVVFFLADDFGHYTISANGNKRVATPNIDRIAHEGVRFTQSYVTSPICCPSRAGILTGRYQQRFGCENQIIYPNNSAVTGQRGKSYDDALRSKGINPDSLITQGIPKSEVTMGELLQAQGYKTALVGKWHSGFYDGYRPHQRGFDYAWGWYGGSTLYYVDESDKQYVTYKDHKGKYDHYPNDNGKYQWNRDEIATGIFKNGVLVDEKEYQTSAIAREAVHFIEENKEHPFFLYVPFGAVHSPLQAPKKYLEQLAHIEDDQQKFTLAMLLSMDEAIGRIQEKLRSSGLYDNTIFVFAGDNGGKWENHGYDANSISGSYYASDEKINLNYPLKGGKSTHYEGGLRTPLLIAWKGHISPGTVYANPVSTLDLFPTFAYATGTPLPKGRQYDGVNLLDYVNKKSKTRPHEALFWRSGFIKTIRKGDYKLMINEEDKTTHLYNLKKDPSEKNDLATSDPAMVKELSTIFINWEKELPSMQRWNSPVKVKVNVEGQMVSWQP